MPPTNVIDIDNPIVKKEISEDLDTFRDAYGHYSF